MRWGCCGSGSEETDDINVAGNVKKFSYKQLSAATHNFHPSNKIGRGGFGIVYKVPMILFIFCVSV